MSTCPSSTRYPSGGASAVSALSSDWQVSGILAVRSVVLRSPPVPISLTGQQNNQRAIQVLDDPWRIGPHGVAESQRVREARQRHLRDDAA